MSKRKKSTPQLYNHNAASAVHRNLEVTSDGRRVHSTINLVDLPSAPQPDIAPYIPRQTCHESVPYVFDDDHIPVDTRNSDDISGVKVKVCKRAKRYENTVSFFLNFRSIIRGQLITPDTCRMNHLKLSSRSAMNISMTVSIGRGEVKSAVPVANVKPLHPQSAAMIVTVASSFVKTVAWSNTKGYLCIEQRYICCFFLAVIKPTDLLLGVEWRVFSTSKPS
jgi:hypothetical protein